MIYFIQMGDDGPIKIGYSEVAPERRLKDMQTGNPAKLRLLAAVVGERDREAEYHKRFAKHKLHGEWFEPAQEILDCCVPQEDDENDLTRNRSVANVLGELGDVRPAERFSLPVLRPQNTVPGKWRTHAEPGKVTTYRVDPGLLRLQAALDKLPHDSETS